MDSSIVSGIEINPWVKTPLIQKIVFLSRYGFCIEISQYDATNEVWISSNTSGMRIFLSDPRRRSYVTLDYSSQNGDIISSSKGIFKQFNDSH